MGDYLKSALIEVKAEQFFAVAPPWPAGVAEDPQTKGAYYFSSPTEGAVGIQDGDWIVTDEHGRRLVLASARFAGLYTPKL